MPDDPDFLTRWSRRKAAARRAEDAPAEEPAVIAAVEPQAGEPGEAAVPVELPEPPELPDPETLEAGSDFKAFMAENVPGDLRRAALRRLWRVNPIIGSLDGLDDHYVTADFTDAARVVPDLRTVYRAGKELLAAAERVDEALEAEAVPPAVAPAPARLAADPTAEPVQPEQDFAVRLPTKP